MCAPEALTLSAWMGLALRDAGRQPFPALATSILTSTQFVVLRMLAPKVGPLADAREVLHAIAILGGFMGRKGDGEPGWRTITRGIQRLFAAEEGYLLGQRTAPPSTA